MGISLKHFIKNVFYSQLCKESCYYLPNENTIQSSYSHKSLIALYLYHELLLQKCHQHRFTYHGHTNKQTQKHNIFF